ncbi:BL22 [Acholeplasma oculi]|uniref:Large ribosomal subunit protein uL18 n=1 Tax=Acholeplasma oculi TaxID=35623 RepID=A0A061AIH4_9MOLU|nr:50S ribosomal protein L18 [Acholeplasma oculi]CDR31426.1 50S ribosomal protein L18 [Acholeplasma oculi]SKC39930.1 LSU ribosomal protein L18P [Acholeplasma oculi]SUT92001.1 BL22 [Acholeplasma oculi]
MINKKSSNVSRQKRHLRIRKSVIGTPERPRLNVFRSNTAIYVQIIDDNAQNTLTSANSKELNLGANIEAATAVGKLVAEKALKLGITKVVFDRGGYLYHGRVKALAEAARAAGLEF